MFAFKPVWYLPASILAIFLLYAFAGVWYSAWASQHAELQHFGVFDKILSQDTINALNRDKRLQHALIYLADDVARRIYDFGEAYDSTSLRDFGRDLSGEVAQWRGKPTQKKRRRFLRGAESLFGGGGRGITGGGLDFTGGLSSILQEGIKNLGGSIVDGLATPALFLGIGIG